MVAKWWLTGGVVRLPSWHTFGAMLVKLSGLISAMAGSVGGLTIQRGQTGQSARSKPLPTLRQSTYSATARARLAQLNKRWAQLTPTQREAWKTFSGTVTWYNRFGDPVPGDGYKAFLRNNASSTSSNANTEVQPIQDDPPSSMAAFFPNDPQLVIASDGSSLQFKSTDAKVDAKTRLFIFASPPVSIGRFKHFGTWKYLAFMDPKEGFPRDLKPEYVAAFGAVPMPEKGWSCFIRVVSKDASSYWPGAKLQLPALVI